MAIETDTTYNGWKNYETWNVVLWLDNDEGLHSLVRHSDSETYEEFVYEYLLELTQATPDGVGYLDRDLDHDALDEYVRETNGTTTNNEE